MGNTNSSNDINLSSLYDKTEMYNSIHRVICNTLGHKVVYNIVTCEVLFQNIRDEAVVLSWAKLYGIKAYYNDKFFLINN